MPEVIYIGRALVKKLVRFLSSLSSVSSKTRDEFKSRMDADNTFRSRIGEKLLLVLDRLDDMGKPELVARAFQAYMEGQIDYDMFQRLVLAIDKSFYSDLMAFKSKRDPNALSPQARLELSTSGISYLGQQYLPLNEIHIWCT